MPIKKRNNNTENNVGLFADITFIPIYHVSKFLASKTPFKENFNKGKGRFIFDCFCTGFWLYVLWWMGGMILFGHHFYFFRYLMGGFIFVVVLCFAIGTLRRKARSPTTKQKVAIEEGIEFQRVTQIDNDKEVQEALMNLGYSRTEAKQGAQYAKYKVPNGELPDKITEALKHFDTSTNN